ncbi:TPA: hypothetical protein ACOB50_002081 [Neisseria gonorrhoeae]
MPFENRSAGFVVHYYVVLQDKAQGKAAGCIVATDNEKRGRCRLNRVLRRV